MEWLSMGPFQSGAFGAVLKLKTPQVGRIKKVQVAMQSDVKTLFQRARAVMFGIAITLFAAYAPAQSPSVSLKIDELNTSLRSPWGLAFLPDGRMLVTEKGGSLKLLSAAGQIQGEFGGVPTVNSAGQGGLLDVVIDPAFATNQRIYLSFSENDGANTNLSGTAVASARLDLAGNQLRDVRVIYRQLPKVNSTGHFGSRLVRPAIAFGARFCTRPVAWQRQSGPHHHGRQGARRQPCFQRCGCTGWFVELWSSKSAGRSIAPRHRGAVGERARTARWR